MVMRKIHVKRSDIMVTRSSVRLSFVLPFLVLVLGAGTASGSSINLLVNPGFETGDFTGWTVNPNTPVYGVAISGTPILESYYLSGPDSVLVHSGNYAAYADLCVLGLPDCVTDGLPSNTLTLSQSELGARYHL
jgi:hypothetical protein